ncbi:MAG: GntR family transcriptional regulator [Firmicutes bacterium]|nr:GntR family transcriptional regulator [Bacillota bacterium]
MGFNRNSAIPLYKQISREIQDGIKKGEYTKDKAMPSEMEIQRKYKVSRVTARKAYKQLVDQGILRTIKGKGTYINDLDANDWTWMHSFTREVIEMGRVPSTRIIEFKEIMADELIAQRLQVPVDEPCYYLKRIRFIDNKPVWLTKSYVPCSLAENLTKEHFSIKGYAQSIFTILELNYGIKRKSGEDISEAISISAKDAPLLNIEINKPVISKAFIAYGDNGKPIIYENTIFEQSISKWG